MEQKKTQQMLSVIIPIRNEFDNLLELFVRIESVLEGIIPFEIIVIDDFSSDKTGLAKQFFARNFPVRIYKKKGERGRAFSILEGISYAEGMYIAVIDADLQYPPEILPEMLNKIGEGYDIVIGNRISDTLSLQNIFFRFHRRIIGSHFHGINTDVNSGMKLFRREIIRRLTLNPKEWTFDVELVVKAKNAGYVIGEISVPYRKRAAGRTKASFLRKNVQQILTGIQLALQEPEIVPFLPETIKEKGRGFHYRGTEYISYSTLPYQRSAFIQFIQKQKFVFLFTLLAILIGLSVDWHTTLVIVIAILTLLYFADLLFNFFLIYRSFSKTPEIKVSDEELTKVNEFDWPSYTIFCPLYKEWEVLPQFIDAMSSLDYPREKLQILLLLEEDDKETIRRVREMSLPYYFTTKIVPHSLPKTKPKALNFGLQHATGEYVVIYDAEDIPDTHQLKKAILAFRKVPKRVVCIQAKLNFYNPHQNLLTRVFTAEYSLWFDLVLTGLQSLHAPIPLGGTSNHFKKSVLQEIEGWDSFNVTEDCDLGMRLVKHGYRTAVIDSITQEEANSNLTNWFNQRTRWVKGYIQSYFVHMRSPRDFIKNWREPHVITFQLVVGGKILSMFINPFMWFITISYFAFRPIVGEFIESFYPAPVLYMGLFSLLIGNFLYMYYYMIGCYKREQDAIIKYVFLVPFYWLAMSISAWRALFQMIGKPHYWPKTKHGFHLRKKKHQVFEEFRLPNLFSQPVLGSK